MLRKSLIVLAMLAVAGQALALTPAKRVALISGGASSYVGPGDLVAGGSFFYSCARGYSRSFVHLGLGRACNLRNTTTNETCDELLTSAGKPGLTIGCSAGSDGRTLAQFCSPGCAVAAAYDQTGHGFNVTQATAGSQPTLTLNCLGSLPCLSGTAAVSLGSFTSITPASGVATFFEIYNRTAGTGLGATIRENAINNRMSANNTSAHVALFGGSSGSFTAAATDAAWHVLQGVLSGASSALIVDATSTSGTATGNTTAAQPSWVVSVATTTTEAAEAGAWDGAALTTAQQTALCKNAQAAYGGGGNFAAAC